LDDIREACSLLAELSQLNSECLISALRRYGPGNLDIADIDDVRLAIYYELGTDEDIDNDDYYRIGRYFEKHHMPTTVSLMATEGLIEDFFGAYTGERSPTAFDPDEDIDVLFPEFI
jgi:hypothetical protein